MEIIQLTKGNVFVYDFGSMKLHNYHTNDALNDQVILLEKNHRLIVIESPTFYDNNEELETYICSLDATIDGVLLAYHMGGGTFLKDVKKYATHHADEYGHVGGGKALIDQFTQSFGEKFDCEIHHVTDYINQGEFTLGGIRLNIIPTADAYDIEIPEINCIYTHMLGSTCHSIIAGASHANQMIATLKEYMEKDYRLILTSHYVPEEISAVDTKIAYIETLLNIASDCKDASSFIQKMEQEFPNYSGKNYLEMTANFFFPVDKK